MLVVNAVTLFYGQGTLDITVLGLPIIIAIRRLILGKRGALALAGLSIFFLQRGILGRNPWPDSRYRLPDLLFWMMSI